MNNLVTTTTLPETARAELAAALGRIRGSRGLVVRMSDLLAGLAGSAAARGLRMLMPPAQVGARARGLAQVALRRAFDVAVLQMPSPGLRARFEARTTRAAAAVSGAVGGFVGMAGFLPDVTMTTLLIMRRIAAIATEEGESLDDPDTRAACLEVFALGGAVADEPWKEGEAPEIGYWGARMVLQGRPLVLLFSEATAAYGLRLSQKLTLQAVPLIGAAGGALVNGAFVGHYESMARAHFVIRRLERDYGAATVREAAVALGASDARMDDAPA